MENLKNYLNSLSPIKDTSWSLIQPLFETRSLTAQQFLIKERVYARKLAFLESGSIRAFYTNEDGREFNQQFFVGPNIVCAYSSLLSLHRNKIPLQALTDCELWVADFKSLTQLYDDHPDLERLGRKIAEHYFFAKENIELDKVLLSPTQRYLNFLKEFPGLDQEIAQYHIASYLSITATQLSRLRKEIALRA